MTMTGRSDDKYEVQQPQEMSIGSMSSDGASRTGAGTTSGAGIKVVRTPGDWKSAEEMTAREQLATVESMEQIEARSADP